jgi:sporulation protein YlmC with PRC-barrel domain
MLNSASAMKGYAIAASDGHVGTVSDVLFDDASWLIRWLVVETGKWLSGRKVLLPPSVLGRLYPESEEFTVELTKKQVEDSPDIDTDRPVSRQFEAALYDHYGWAPYWIGGFSPVSYNAVDDAMASSFAAVNRQREEHDNPHLRSVEAVTGYHIHAVDGAIGHVEDFLMDDSDWSIRWLVVDTKNWLPGKRVLISPRSIQEIDWADRQINLSVDRERVRGSPAYDASMIVDPVYEKAFHDYYSADVPPTRLPSSAL